MKKVLFCHCAYTDILPYSKKRAVLCSLANADVDLIEVKDLCELAARKDPDLIQHLMADELTVIACHHRAVRWLLESAGVDQPERIDLLDMRTSDAESILEHFAPVASTNEKRPTDMHSPHEAANTEAPPDSWVPWFPVIDYSRCSNCRQCLSFCLFGVYETTEDGTVVVANPSNCKNNCPACARICPEIAIMFPKLTEEPLNGAEILDENTERARVKLDVDKILGSDAYAALAERKRKRQKMVLMKRNIEQAKKERDACSSQGSEGE